MEYDDDEQFEDLFMTEKMEKVLAEKLMVDVPAEQYKEFGELLATDLFKKVKEEGLECLEEFSYTP